MHAAAVASTPGAWLITVPNGRTPAAVTPVPAGRGDAVAAVQTVVAEGGPAP